MRGSRSFRTTATGRSSTSPRACATSRSRSCGRWCGRRASASTTGGCAPDAGGRGAPTCACSTPPARAACGSCCAAAGGWWAARPTPSACARGAAGSSRSGCGERSGPAATCCGSTRASWPASAWSCASGGSEATERALGPHGADALAEDAEVGELLARAQRRPGLMALGLEFAVRDRVGERLGEDGRRAAAVAELGLVAPQQLVRQPALERLAQQPLLGLAVARDLPGGRQPQCVVDHLAVEERDARLEAVRHRHAVAALEV